MIRSRYIMYRAVRSKKVSDKYKWRGRVVGCEEFSCIASKKYMAEGPKKGKERRTR